MATTDEVKDGLRDACVTLLQAGTGAAQAAMATAGVVSEEQFAALAPGVRYPSRNLNDAGALASQAAQTMAAVYSCADALAKLETAFPTPDPPP